jgi:nitroimidazol reductase NimA-like FMN-containing flavoprotein (pyridoxamine 5'-phosphate oxidase superfamily)
MPVLEGAQRLGHGIVKQVRNQMLTVIRILLRRATAARARTSRRSRVSASALPKMGRLLPAWTALHFSVEYGGVAVFGQTRVIEEDVEAKCALQKLLDKYAPHLRPGRDYRPIQPEELAVTSVYRIENGALTSKNGAANEKVPSPITPEHSCMNTIPSPCLTNGGNDGQERD